MANESPHSLEVIRTATDLLVSARLRVGRRIGSMLAAEGLKRVDAIDYLDGLVAELRRSISDPTLAPSGKQVHEHALFHPTLDAISAEALQIPDDPRTASAAIDLLRAIQTFRAAADGSRSAASNDDDLRTRLRAPDAFELLVEVGHDFRSPLTSILFLSETLRDGHSGPVTELQRSQLGLMYSAAFGLASIASDVMDLARREQDLIEDETEPYALAEVFQSVERLVCPIVEEKGLELNIVVPERAQAHGHPHALSRVLLNLTTNALKFTDEGRVEIGVLQRPHARLEFYVQDTGRGIPEARQSELFQPFKSRIGQAQEGHFFSGSGVGLSIARRLVRAMDSELHFTTSDEAGTRFWFTVPASPKR